MFYKLTGLLVGRLLAGYLTPTAFTSHESCEIMRLRYNLLLGLYPIWLASWLKSERLNPNLCFGIFNPLICYLKVQIFEGVRNWTAGPFREAFGSPGKGPLEIWTSSCD